MNTNINKILNDLYIIDPELKKQEPELIKIINQLIESRPDTEFDENFARQLKLEILEKAEELKSKKNNNIFKYIFMKKFAYGVGAVAVVALLAIVSLNLLSQETQIVRKDGLSFAKLPSGAFGSLSGLDQSSISATPEAGRNVEGLGAGDSGAVMDSPISSEGKIGIMPPYYETRYEYVYAGEEFTIEEDRMEVYRRIKSMPNQSALNSLISGLDLSLLNLGAFQNLEMQSLSFLEDREYGLAVSLSPNEGAVSIYENWQKWPNAYNDCRDENCYEANRLRIEQVPSDEEVIRLANDFVNQYGIDLSAYGDGEVDNRWRENYERTEDKRMFYVPEYLSVVYPLLINDGKVHDSSGELDGLRININIRHLRASGAWNIVANNYEASEYEVVKDTEKLIDLAEKGGQNIYYGETSEVVKIEIGTPEVVYIKHYQYKDNQSDELLIPALRFPIINKPIDSYIWQNNIVVPLVKEIFDERQVEPYPMPRPMIEPMIMEDSVGSDISTSDN